LAGTNWFRHTHREAVSPAIGLPGTGGVNLRSLGEILMRRGRDGFPVLRRRLFHPHLNRFTSNGMEGCRLGSDWEADG
jgi:hypothetical protein